MRAPKRKTAGPVLALTVAAAVALAPGCIFGSPIAAFSGEPYGMTRDDWSAIGGKRQPIWGGHPVFAAIDLPFAFVLDTGFLPISLIVWGLKALGDGGEDDGHGHGHSHGEGEDHSHDDDDADDHEHGAEPEGEGPQAARDDLHSHGDGYQHRHEGGHLPHTHEAD
jgi:uncharacterized protein YceK